MYFLPQFSHAVLSYYQFENKVTNIPQLILIFIKTVKKKSPHQRSFIRSYPPLLRKFNQGTTKGITSGKSQFSEMTLITISKEFLSLSIVEWEPFRWLCLCLWLPWLINRLIMTWIEMMWRLFKAVLLTSCRDLVGSFNAPLDSTSTCVVWACAPGCTWVARVKGRADKHLNFFSMDVFVFLIQTMIGLKGYHVR